MSDIEKFNEFNMDNYIKFKIAQLVEELTEEYKAEYGDTNPDVEVWISEEIAKQSVKIASEY